MLALHCLYKLVIAAFMIQYLFLHVFVNDRMGSILDTVHAAGLIYN